MKLNIEFEFMWTKDLGDHYLHVENEDFGLLHIATVYRVEHRWIVAWQIFMSSLKRQNMETEEEAKKWAEEEFKRLYVNR